MGKLPPEPDPHIEPIRKPKGENGLPCPDPVPVPDMKHTPRHGWDSLAWHMVRHFILGAAGAAAVSLASGGTAYVVAGAALAGGLAEAKRKQVDDKRRAEGKDDLITVVGKFLTLMLELVRMWRARKK
jgi:hypothetical protein